MKKILNNNVFLQAIYTLGIITSIFIKAFYLQYTISLANIPFKNNGQLHTLILISTIEIVFFTLLISQKKSKYFLLGLNIIISMILFFDTGYGRYYGIPITMPILYQLGFMNDISSSAKALLKWKDIIYIIDIPVFIVFIYFFKENLTAKNSLKRNILFLIIFGIAITSFHYEAKDINRNRHIYERKNIAKDLGVFYFHGYDIIDFARNKILSNASMDEEEKKLITDYFNDNKKTLEPMNIYTDSKNILIVQVEAMQEFVVDLKINGEEVMPFLNQLKKDNIYFDNIYHQVAAGNTVDAELMVNTGLFPAPIGAVNYIYSTNKFITLNQLLKDKGYTSMSFHGYESSFWNREVMYQNYGFNKFFSQKDFDLSEIMGWSISDKSFFEQSVDFSVKHQPFYSFLITLSSHHPYDQFSEENFDVNPFEDTQVGNYLKSMHYVDYSIKILFEKLKKDNILSNTIVIVYGDHSALFLDQKDSLNKLLNLDDSNISWEKIQKVPLLMILPDSEMKGTISKIGGQIDILPTIVDIMGLDHPFLIGHSLLKEESNYAIKRDGSIFFDQYYFDNSKEILYDINTLTKVEMSDDILTEIENYEKDLMISDLILRKNLFSNEQFLKIIR